MLTIEYVLGFISTAIANGTPLLFGAVGEILTEKSGNLNLGTPGIMVVGGISGIIGGSLYEGACHSAGITPIPILCVVVALLSPISCFRCVSCKHDAHRFIYFVVAV